MTVKALSSTESTAPVQTMPYLAPQDVEMTLKAIRGIADVTAGRCAPIEEVRARVLSRYVF